MSRTIVVTGAASGIGAATTQYLKEQGHRVITADLHSADVIADLATVDGREALVSGVARLSDDRIDAVLANAGGGPADTSIQLNFFGAVATLEGLRPLMAASDAPRAAAVSSVSCLSPPHAPLLQACLDRDEPRALQIARQLWEDTNTTSGEADAGLALYGNAKHALNRWCRLTAPTAQWAGAGILLNAVPLGFYDTPAAAYVLGDAQARADMATLIPVKGAFPGKPREAAKLLAFLLSADNTQVTGQVLFADGGLEAKAMGPYT